MLSHKMLVQNMLWGRLCIGVNGQGQNCHPCDFFQHNSVVDSLCRVFAPGKGTVAGTENTGYMHRVNAAVLELSLIHISEPTRRS